MIKILILEDELPARKKLKRYLAELQLDVNDVAEIESIEAGIAYLHSSPALDLIISDIELRDGNVFDIFEEINFPCPIIFTTAYNEFWLQAFETNGISYLLKPFSLDKFQQAWYKFQSLTQKNSVETALLRQMKAVLNDRIKHESIYRSRFAVPSSRGNYFLETSDLVYFLAESGLVYGNDASGKRHLMKEVTIKEIENQLDPNTFFRINRSELIQKKFITGTERYSKNSVGIKMRGIDRLLICSQSQTPIFLNWVEK